MFLVFFFPLRFFYFIFHTTYHKLLYNQSYFISNNLYTVSRWLALKWKKTNKNSGLNQGWDKLCSLFKKIQQIFADKLVSQLHESESADAGLPFFPITQDKFPIKANTCCISHFPP